MMATDEESRTCTESTEKRKKKKQKQEKTEKSIVEESQCHPNENTKKKRVSVSEDASDITDVAPKKKNKKALDEDVASCHPKTNGEKTSLDKEMSSGYPTSTNETHKKKKKKKVVDNETSTCDPKTTEDAPKKKKKKFAEDIVTKKKKKMLPKDDGVTLQTTNECVLKSKAVSEDESLTLEVPEDDIVTKKKGTKKGLFSSHISEDKDDQGTDGLHCSHSDSMSSPKLKKCKKSKQPKNNSEDKAVDTGNVLTDVTVIQKKRKVSELEEESGSPIEDQPKMSDHAKVKNKKKKPSSENTEGKVIEDLDVHHGEAGGDSLRVSKKKKTSKGSLIEESGLKEPDLNRYSVKDNNITEGTLKKKKKKKKKGNKAKEASKLVDGAEESLHVTCHKEEKKKSKKKSKGEEIPEHTDKEHSANVDTSEVPKKKKTSKEETKNSKEARKKQVNRKALQEDIDRKSGNSKGTKFGQWDTAKFQNSDQQTKFFRLLGGLKKGNQNSFSTPLNHVKANMALGKEGGQVLERNLLEEFNKAVSWKKNRGTGLGFKPAQTKTFYIDKAASKSKKFKD